MRRRLRAALAAVALAAAALLLAGCGGADSAVAVATTTDTVATTTVPVTPAMTQGRSFVVYAKPTRAQFINHADDRERGDVTNPLFPDILPTPPNANSGKKGGRAGDSALLSFKLYSDLNLTRPVGDAIYSCTFNFAHEASCEANFNLNGGTLIAMGPADMDSSDLVLPVTGGTGRYAGAHGQMESRSAGKKNTQIFRFRLVG